MKTNPTPRLAPRLRWRCANAAVVAIGCLWSMPVFATLPAEEEERARTAPPAEMTAVEVDPYVAFLESLDARNEDCRVQSLTLRSLLAERAVLTERFRETPPGLRDDITADLAVIDRKIDAAESTLRDSVAATTPGDAPDAVLPPPVDLEKLQKESRRLRRPVYPPVPQPTPVPSLPAPPAERLYVEYLANLAGDSDFAQGLVRDVARMLKDRRELAWRHSRARANERAALETSIFAVSQRIRASAQAAAEGAAVRGW